MSEHEEIAAGLNGRFRDVLRRADGSIAFDSGWQPNAILTGFRTLLAGFARGAPTTVSGGIEALLVGRGKPEWDQPPGPPTPTPDVTALADPAPHAVVRANLKLDFVDPVTGVPSPVTPTRSVQISASLGPGVPPPNPNLNTTMLREFGLVASLQGTRTLLNYRTHPVIAKDPASTLDRTIWLVF